MCLRNEYNMKYTIHKHNRNSKCFVFTNFIYEIEICKFIYIRWPAGGHNL